MQPNLKLATFLSAVVATVSGAAVAPVVERAERLAARADGNMYICTDAGWQGSCTNLSFSAGGCVNFPSGFHNDVSSIGPDNGWNCYAYKNYGCDDGQGNLYIDYPGSSDLSPYTGGWNDVLNSFVCYPF